MSVRFESSTFTTGGRTYKETKVIDTKHIHIDHKDRECCHAVYFGPVEGTDGKIARVALWTITGTCVGASVGSVAAGIGAGPGAGAGALIGAGIGFCTLF
jgi:hypothetical protein